MSMVHQRRVVFTLHGCLLVTGTHNFEASCACRATTQLARTRFHSAAAQETRAGAVASQARCCCTHVYVRVSVCARASAHVCVCVHTYMRKCMCVCIAQDIWHSSARVLAWVCLRARRTRMYACICGDTDIRTCTDGWLGG